MKIITIAFIFQFLLSCWPKVDMILTKSLLSLMTRKSIGRPTDYLIFFLSFQPCEGLLALVMFPMSGCMCPSSDDKRELKNWNFIFVFIQIFRNLGEEGS